MGVSRGGIHIEVNAAYARLFGYDSPASLVGVPVLDLVHESEHARIRELIARRVRGEASASHYPMKATLLDGSTLLSAVFSLLPLRL